MPIDVLQRSRDQSVRQAGCNRALSAARAALVSGHLIDVDKRGRNAGRHDHVRVSVRDLHGWKHVEMPAALTEEQMFSWIVCALKMPGMCA